MIFNSDERFKDEAESLIKGMFSLEQTEPPSLMREGAKQLAQFVSAHIGVGFSREEAISIALKYVEMGTGNGTDNG